MCRLGSLLTFWRVCLLRRSSSHQLDRKEKQERLVFTKIIVFFFSDSSGQAGEDSEIVEIGSYHKNHQIFKGNSFESREFLSSITVARIYLISSSSMQASFG
jgi:hypothetical protein